MRRVIVSAFVSLDGVAEGADRFDVDWDDDEMDAHGAAAIATQDAVVLGRRTYDEWQPFWPGSTLEPFASFVNRVPKYVATSTPLTAGWAGAEAIDGDPVAFVSALKQQPGGDIGVHGSISVVGSLLAAGLVDGLSLAVLPVIVGSGRRLLDGAGGQQRLELLSSARTAGGKLLLTYRVDLSS